MEGMGLITKVFWSGKRVFLTGHTGFKGSWLALWLQRLGAEVTGYALTPPTDPNLFSLAQVYNVLRDIRGDICDLHKLQNAMAEAEPEIVIHMAAQALVRRSYDDPVETYASNVIGTVNLLEAVRHTCGVRAVLNVTSDKCYENREWLWGYRENEAMGGFDPYSSSKACAELVTTGYRKSYFSNTLTAVASARAGNVIGGGDWARDRLVPDMVRAALGGHTAIVRNPGAVRPWQHVLEPLSGYLMLAERLFVEGQKFAEGWNFGPLDNDAKPVESIAEQLASLWDRISWERGDASNPHEAHNLKLDCTKARERLGWMPRLSLRQALAWTIDWYQAYADGSDMQRLTGEQIENYIGLGKVDA
jgi:CDP-glucose 4,6-dehydratase